MDGTKEREGGQWTGHAQEAGERSLIEQPCLERRRLWGKSRMLSS